MAQLNPQNLTVTRITSSEIDLVWSNDPHAQTVIEYYNGAVGNQSFSSYQARNLHAGGTYQFWIVNTAPNYAEGQTPYPYPLSVKTHNTSAQSYLVQAEVSSSGQAKAEGDSSVQGSFDLLVPKQTFIAHYTHPDNTILQGGWSLVDTLTLPGGTQTTGNALSLIQSFLTPDGFEAIARVKPQQGTEFLISYQFRPATGHQNPISVVSDQGPIDQVSGVAALAQTDQGTFQLIVPRAGAISTYTHPSDTVQGTWITGPTLSPPNNSQVPAVLLAQTDGMGGFVMLARVTPADGSGDTMATYQLVGDSEEWQGPFSVTANGRPITPVTGRPTLIQSNNGDQARFELLVPINGQLQHYTHTPGSIEGDWSFVATLRPAKNNPQIKPASTSLVQDDTGNLNAVARVAPQQGNNFFVAYQFNPNTGWSNPSIVVDNQGNVITAGGDND
jgi:hypothetical protein